ncbi:hypothetical protein TCDM_12566 [Trypanosoma cruzi Dm28c]|uniref:Uncharacterized protein n=1 Tax=Trypanosoma cruzi Dm28c TaxID=1416333 RepID=V5AQK4_TRYCR|nr:hypothetical protein TCDM_12566 [Trypanosoma cruzi Dm28c]
MKKDERISTAIHSEWHHHPRRSHSQQQQLTHTDTRNETEEQCTGNTQRLPPPAAAGVTASALFVTRQHTPSNTHTQKTTGGTQKTQMPLAKPTRCHESFYCCLLQPSRFSFRAQPGNPHRPIRSVGEQSARAAAGRQSIHTRPGHSQYHSTNCTPATHQKTNLALPSSLFAGRAAAKFLCVHSFSEFRPLHSVSEKAYMFLCVCMCFCFRSSAPIVSKRLCGTKKKETAGRETEGIHTKYSYHHTHTHTHAAAEWVHSTTKSKRKTKQKAEAWDYQRTHTLITPVKQNTHTEGEREGSPTQCK